MAGIWQLFPIGAVLGGVPKIRQAGGSAVRPTKGGALLQQEIQIPMSALGRQFGGRNDRDGRVLAV